MIGKLRTGTGRTYRMLQRALAAAADGPVIVFGENPEALRKHAQAIARTGLPDSIHFKLFRETDYHRFAGRATLFIDHAAAEHALRRMHPDLYSAAFQD